MVLNTSGQGCRGRFNAAQGAFSSMNIEVALVAIASPLSWNLGTPVTSGPGLSNLGSSVVLDFSYLRRFPLRAAFFGPTTEVGLR